MKIQAALAIWLIFCSASRLSGRSISTPLFMNHHAARKNHKLVGPIAKWVSVCVCSNYKTISSAAAVVRAENTNLGVVAPLKGSYIIIWSRTRNIGWSARADTLYADLIRCWEVISRRESRADYRASQAVYYNTFAACNIISISPSAKK
jgi:hypothetical protein